MILRFQQMLPCADSAKSIINKVCRFLSMNADNPFEEFGSLKKQFYIRPDLDLFIDDDMNEEAYGYILKALRTIGLLSENAEIIEPNRNYPVSEDVEEALSLDGDAGSEPDIISFEDYLPENYYDDGNFEAEMEEILNMNDEDDE